jgi:hypothetical protein
MSLSKDGTKISCFFSGLLVGRLKKREILALSFDRLRMRPRVLDGLPLMVSLSNHERVAVRQAHHEAMGDMVRR